MWNSRRQVAFGLGAAAVLLCAAVSPAPAMSYGTNSAGDWGTASIWTPNGVPGANDTVTINHAVTVAGEQSIRRITINAAGSLTPGAGVNLNVWGSWTNNGTFDEGTSSVTFRGITVISGTGTHRFHDVNITDSLAAPSANVTVTGDWNCTGRFSHGSGRIIFGGTTIRSSGTRFFRFNVNKTAGGDVTLLDDMVVGDSLKVLSGTLVVGANALTLGGTTRYGRAFVSGPATLSVRGTGPGATGKVLPMNASYPYTLRVLSGGTIAARYAQFTGMDAAGIVVNSGAFVDATDNFSNCAFDHGSVTTGPMLKIESDQVIDDMMYASFTATGGSNIEKSGATGHVTVHGGDGS
ncbi:hypothetical protein FJY71_05970, partial [candidate division WOR-3 bacterium]|nr:hypothetical protein [candidate division WOR-3 bacterium]